MCFYKQGCFPAQAKICLSEFLVTDSKHTRNMLISKHVKFCYMLLNNGSSLYMQIKSNGSTDQYDANSFG